MSRVAGILALFVLLPGCYTYGLYDQENLYAKRASRRLVPYPLTLRLTTRTLWEIDGQTRQPDLQGSPELARASVVVQDRAFRFLENSGMFRDVVTGDRSRHDVSLDINFIVVTDSGAPTRAFWLKLLSTLSLTAIPVWGTDQFALEFVGKSGRGEEFFRERYHDRTRTVVWLPLAVTRLFSQPDPHAVIRNAAHHAIRDFQSSFLAFQRRGK